MIIVHVGEPLKRALGDVWFDPTTKQTSKAGILTSGLVVGASTAATQIVWIPLTARHVIPPSTNGLQAGFVHIDYSTHIPHLWDGTSWISAVTPNYIFPTQPPNVGDFWQESMSGYYYTYVATGWIALNPTITGVTSVNAGAAPVPQYTISTGGGGVASPPTISLTGAASGGVTYVISNTQSKPVFTIGPPSSPTLQIQHPQTGNLMVLIDPTNQVVTFGATYKPDITADTFWRTVMQNYPDNMITTLRNENKLISDELQQYKDAGFKLRQKQKVIDPNDAWDAAMGIIK